eukprot:6676301-Prymnesium_polylepis.1
MRGLIGSRSAPTRQRRCRDRRWFECPRIVRMLGNHVGSPCQFGVVLPKLSRVLIIFSNERYALSDCATVPPHRHRQSCLRRRAPSMPCRACWPRRRARTGRGDLDEVAKAAAQEDTDVGQLIGHEAFLPSGTSCLFFCYFGSLIGFGHLGQNT